MAIDYNEYTSHWKILFTLRGSVWLQVLPYCIINVLSAYLVSVASHHGVRISFSPQGHALMSLIITFLVVTKIHQAFDRYMEARTHLGHLLCSCRDINQHAIIFTETQADIEASKWREDVTRLTLKMMSTTIQVIKDRKKAYLFVKGDCNRMSANDPMTHVMLLRSKIMHGADACVDMIELEKLRILDIISKFVDSKRDLLKLASTPLPFPMIQMGRTCLFLWVFTLPFVLVGVIDELLSVLVFIFFLTYGFIGLELVAMQLLNPFGDGVNDLGVDSMVQTTIQCIENDVAMRGKEEPARYEPPPEHPNRQPASPFALEDIGSFIKSFTSA